MQPVANLELTKLAAGELPGILGFALTSGATRRVVAANQVRSFLRHLSDTGAVCHGWAARDAASLVGVCAAVVLPGRTALLMPALPGAGGMTVAGCLAAGQAAMQELARLQLHYVQALCEPDLPERSSLLEELGLTRLTLLSYMERDPRYPWIAPPEPDRVEWITYSETTSARFRDLIERTYVDSLDCPGLNGLRPMEDVLAAHRAAGQFNPDLWQIARIDGADAGVVLLSRIANGRLMELSYMGVHPQARGRGTGRLLVRRAIAMCREVRAQRITLVVDESNTPARALYELMSFRVMTQRIAYCHVPDRSKQRPRDVGNATKV